MGWWALAGHAEWLQQHKLHMHCSSMRVLTFARMRARRAAAARSGYLAYEEIVAQLLDEDYYAMYSPAGVDNTQVCVPRPPPPPRACGRCSCRQQRTAHSSTRAHATRLSAPVPPARHMQALVDAQTTERLVANLRKRINGSVADMRAIFGSFEAPGGAGAGALPPKAFTAGCAALGVVLSAKEQAWVAGLAPAGAVDWRAFCDALDSVSRVQ